MNQPNFEAMTDDELERHYKALKKSSMPNFENMTDEELDKHYQTLKSGNEKTALQSLGELGTGAFDIAAQGVGLITEPITAGAKALMYAGDQFNKYVQAPTRSAAMASLEGRNPIEAFRQQVGEPVEQAPSGADFTKKLGFSTEPRNLLDPTRFIPGSEPIGKYLEATGMVPSSDIRPSDADITGVGVEFALDPTWIMPVRKTKEAVTKTTGYLADKYITAGAKALDYPTTKNYLESAYNAVKGAVKTIKESFSPKRVNDSYTNQKTALMLGLDPNKLPLGAMIGKEKSAAITEKTIAGGPHGDQYKKMFDQVDKKISAYLNEFLNRMSGGANLDQVSIGDMISKAYDNSIDKILSNTDMVYMDLVPTIGKFKISLPEQSKIINYAEQLTRNSSILLNKFGFTMQPSERDRLAQTISIANGLLEKSAKGNISLKYTDFENLLKLKQTLGKTIYKKPVMAVDVSPEYKKLQKIYIDIRDSLRNVAKDHLGDDFYNNLVDSDEKLSRFLSHKKVLERTLSSGKKSPDEIFTSLVRKGNVKELRALRAILGNKSQEWSAIRASYLKDGIDRHTSKATGDILYNSLAKDLERNAPALVRFIQQGEFNELKDVINLGRKVGTVAEANPSKTSFASRFKHKAMDFIHEVAFDKPYLEKVRSDILNPKKKMTIREDIMTPSKPGITLRTGSALSSILNNNGTYEEK